MLIGIAGTTHDGVHSYTNLTRGQIIDLEDAAANQFISNGYAESRLDGPAGVGYKRPEAAPHW